MGLLSRGGVVTLGCKARSPVRGLSPGEQAAQAALGRTCFFNHRRSIRTGTGRIIRPFTSSMQTLETPSGPGSGSEAAARSVPVFVDGFERDEAPTTYRAEALCNTTCEFGCLADGRSLEIGATFFATSLLL